MAQRTPWASEEKEMAKKSELSGIFDWFRKKKPGPSLLEYFGSAKSGELIPRPAAPPAPARPPERKVSFFEYFAPKAIVPAPPPSPAEMVLPEAEPRETRLWESIFGPPAPAPEPIQEVIPQPVEAPPPKAPGKKYAFIRVPIEEEHKIRGRLPSVEELRSHLQKKFKLEQVFGELLESRKTPGFTDALAKLAIQGYPLMVPIDPVVYREFYTDFADLFGIPVEMLIDYVRHARSEEEQKALEEKLWQGVLQPLILRLTEALDMLKPLELPGWFTVVYNEEKGTYYLYYIEAMLEPFIPRTQYGLTYEGTP